MDNLLTLKSDQGILNSLYNAARQNQTTAQINEQRISFISGSMHDNANITKAQIKSILNEKQGIAA